MSGGAGQGMDPSGWPASMPGQPPVPGHGQVLLTIGDMAVTPTHVLTPAGPYPLAGTTWIVQDNVQTTESIPAWAIVMVVLFVWFCFLGLLFLLVKERRTTGWIQVGVQGPGLFHATQVPITVAAQVGFVHQQVNYVRSVVASGQAPPAQLG